MNAMYDLSMAIAAAILLLVAQAFGYTHCKGILPTYKSTGYVTYPLRFTIAAAKETR